MKNRNELIRVADYIAESLYSAGAKHVFMVTGRGALFLTDAVAKHKELKSISVHHEQSAAYAAVAYADYTGKPGACMVSTGCAGTNAITGVLNAWQDGIPCVFVSGQNKLQETTRYTGIPIRTYGQQEADIIPLVESITKHAVMITDPKQIVYEMGKALYLSQNGRKGPVWIDIPLDVQNMRIRPSELKHFEIKNEEKHEPLNDDINYIINALSKAKRPVILIGSGIRSAEAIEEFHDFIDKNQIPVTYAGSATDTYADNNSLSIGSVGIMGCTRAGNFTVQNSDLLLVLGSRLSSMTTGPEVNKFAREAKIIIVDIDPVEHSKSCLNIDRLIIADVKKVINVLRIKSIDGVNQQWIDKCQHWKNIFPRCEEENKSSKEVDLYQLAESLSNVMPKESVFISDSGMIELVLPTNINFKKEQRSIHPASQGSMGFALPGIIGAYYASNHTPVCVVGDGSIMMNLQELATIKYNNIPAKIFVVNNNAYAVIRKRMDELFRRSIGTDGENGVGIPDFKKISEGFEIPYVKIETSLNLEKQLQSVIEMEGPVLCEIMGIENQNYISSGHARNSKGAIVSRPLEDQTPYMNRDLFLSEMIVTPIDQ
jgi:acetolactate synthase-1/2/3 large subunit